MRMYSASKIKLIVPCMALLLSTALLISVGWGCGKEISVERKRIRLGYLNNDLHQLAFYVAQQKGYFQEEGLEVEVAGVYNSGPEEMGAFQAGALDIGYVGAAPAILAVANGKANVVAVAQANLNGSALVASPASGARSVSDLKGKKVAVPNVGTVQDFLLRKALSEENLTVHDIQEVYMAPPQMLAALSTSSVDACLVWEPFVSQMVTQGWGRIVSLSSDIWEDHPCCLVVAGEEFLREHPDAVDALVRAHQRATAFLQDHSEEALSLAAEFTGLKVDVVDMALSHITYKAEIGVGGLREYAQFLTDQGLAKIVDIEAFLDDFIR